MKNIITVTILLAMSLVSFGQKNSDIAYINLNEIMIALPVTDSIQKVLEAERLEFEQVFEEMNVEYNKMFEDYQEKQDTYSELVKKTKGEDLLAKQNRLTQFEQNANNTLQQHNMEMLQPVYQKIQNAIDKVSKEKGIDYVIDLSKGTVVYTSPEAVNLNEAIIALVK
ncbi:MAG: OmpH family outer membrane protein [Marinilabiliaceae bacterium]|jgi:outer membrane protein|nr:OmpH family outer membrane protein [Marinilabiliaceae bacterium]